MIALILTAALALGADDPYVGLFLGCQHNLGTPQILVLAPDGSEDIIATFSYALQLDWPPDVVPRSLAGLRPGAILQVDKRSWPMRVRVLNNFDDRAFGMAQDRFVNAVTRGGGLGSADLALLRGLGSGSYKTRRAAWSELVARRRTSVAYRGLMSQDAEVRNLAERAIASWSVPADSR